MIVAPVAKKRQKQKLEAVEYASLHNFYSAAKHYQINRTAIISLSHQVEALRDQAEGYRLEGGKR
jgi:hypothetical protein